MINSIKIKSTASFCENGIEINDLRKINFIYGSNGTGKTTIANFMQDVESDHFEGCELEWTHNQPLSRLVYNKNFRVKNLSQDDIDGIFTLGEATKEDILKIEKKEAELEEIKTQGRDKRESKSKLEIQLNEEIERFRESAWSLFYKKNEKNFKEAFRGALDKARFYNKLLEEADKNISEVQDFDDLLKRAKTIFETTPVELPKIDSIGYDRIIEIENDGIWEKKIIGKADVDIAKLIQKLNINDWVNEGRNYISESDICPFCQQETITQEFRKQIEDYFDEEYISSLARIKTLRGEYELLTSNLQNILDELESKEKANTRSKLKISEFEALLKTYRSQISNNEAHINTKEKEPSRIIELVSIKQILDEIQALIENANTLIEENNRIVAQFNREKQTLIKDIWQYVAKEASTEIDPHQKKIKGLRESIKTGEDNIEELTKKQRALNTEIQELNKDVTSIQPTVDEINRTLSAFGFNNFQIVPSPSMNNKYQIQRETGELVKSTLSEGEITFITFLYFLQLAKGGLSEETVNEDRILVIDDPISSLDSNVLFVVGSLIKELIKEIKAGTGKIKQLILLTHNVYFHKEVSFIDGKIKQCRDVNYWILRKKNRVSSIQAYEMNNPISTSYELLWHELKNRESNSGITIQNVMRRIIENYFKILGKYGNDDLMKKFEYHEDKEICRSLICWINEGSHTISEDLFVEVPNDAIERYFKVFRQIFEKTDHLAHYNMMMEIEEETEAVLD